MKMTTNAIGIRATPQEVYFAICSKQGTSVSIISASKLVIPKVFEFPEKLKFIRNTILDILNEYQIRYAGIRIAEENKFKKPDPNRIAIEAIIQESIASSSIEKYYIGKIGTIESKLKISAGEFKKILVEDQHDQIDNWSQYCEEERESILTSISSLNL